MLFHPSTARPPILDKPEWKAQNNGNIWNISRIQLSQGQVLQSVWKANTEQGQNTFMLFLAYALDPTPVTLHERYTSAQQPPQEHEVRLSQARLSHLTLTLAPQTRLHCLFLPGAESELHVPVISFEHRTAPTRSLLWRFHKFGCALECLTYGWDKVTPGERFPQESSLPLARAGSG